MSAVAAAERRARAVLAGLVEPAERPDAADFLLPRMVAAWGPVETLGRLRAGGLNATTAAQAVPEVAAALAAGGGDLRTLVEAITVRVRRTAHDGDPPPPEGVRFVVPGDDEWPAGVDDLELPPLGLWVRGPDPLDVVCRRAVAVVGSRSCTGYGEHVAGELGSALAERGWTVVSGGAFGIDAASHRGALAAGGTTVAVLACGVDVAYPRAHETLLTRIVGAGALVSELPPGSAPLRHRFLSRNRLIAALTAGTVIVEAAARSGARNTVRHARSLGRPVMAVPGPVTSTMSVGCHEELRHPEPAICVTRAEEVLDVVGRLGADLADPVQGAPTGRDRLPSGVRRVLEAVPVRRAAPSTRIAAVAGVDPRTARRILGQLLAEGLVEQDEGGYRLSAAGRASAERVPVDAAPAPGQPAPGRPAPQGAARP